MELFVRASRNDHTVIEHFLAPAANRMLNARIQPIDAVVADAQVAAERPQLAQLTADAGVPYVIDPLTPLLQSVQPADDPWTKLPFAHAEALTTGDLTAAVMDELIERVFYEQLQQGATFLVPPYFYSNKRGDAWMDANIAILRRAGGYLTGHGIKLPVLAVFAASLGEYAPQNAWKDGLTPFLNAATDVGVARVALSWSWNAQPRSKDAQISLLLSATAEAAHHHDVIGWRSGLFGLPLTAVGATGYETGIGAREALHYVTLQADHKPKTAEQLENSTPRLPAFTYFTEFGRSVLRRGADVLLADPRIAGTLVCDPNNACCSSGAESMRAQWREHTVRERARELREMSAMPPSAAWRLNDVATKAARAETTARTANEILAENAINLTVPADSFASLQRVSTDMLSSLNRAAA